MSRTNAYQFRWRIYSICLLLLGFTGGFNEFFVDDYDPLTILWILALRIYLVLWCATDARRQGLTLIHSWNLPMVSMAPLFVPCYFLWSRGFRGVRAFLGYGLLWFGVAMLGAIAAQTLYSFFQPNLY